MQTKEQITEKMIQELESQLYQAESDLIDLKRQIRWGWYTILIEIAIALVLIVIEQAIVSDVIATLVYYDLLLVIILLFFASLGAILYSFLRVLANCGICKRLGVLFFKAEENTNKYLQNELKKRIEKLREKINLSSCP